MSGFDAAAVPMATASRWGAQQVAVDWLDVAHPQRYDTVLPIDQSIGGSESEVADIGSAAEIVALEGDESYEI